MTNKKETWDEIYETYKGNSQLKATERPAFEWLRDNYEPPVKIFNSPAELKQAHVSHNEIILPSDAEIEKKAESVKKFICDDYSGGAIWMREEIKERLRARQNNEVALPPFLQKGSKVNVCDGGYIRLATITEIDICMNVSPFVEKYFTIKLEKNGGNGG